MLAVLGAVAVVAYRNHDEVVRAIRVIGRVSPWFVAAAAAAIAGVYFCRGSAYRIALSAMEYTFGRWFLARTALVATTAHHLIPTGGASGYAFITYAFHQRGVPAGRASMLALVDTLSNSIALGSLVVVVLVHLAFGASISRAIVGLGLVPGLMLLALAGAFYYLQRNRERFEGFVLKTKTYAARLLRRRWPDAPVHRFVDEYFAGKRLIVRRPWRFAIMVGWQYGGMVCNCAALYLIFYALGVVPSVWSLFVGLVLALAGVALVAVPAGGGSFEVVMSTYFSTHGIATADSIAAALLFRLVAFWAPLALSTVIVLALRHRRNTVRHAGHGGHGGVLEGDSERRGDRECDTDRDAPGRR